MNEKIAAILDLFDIDPAARVGEGTAFQFLESAIEGALDTIEDEIN